MTSVTGALTTPTTNTTDLVTTRNQRYTTEDMTTSNYTKNTEPASGPQNEGGGDHPRWRPSQWPTAAVLGGIVLLALIGVVVVLLYRKKRQRDFHKRHKSSEERMGFIDADAENRRSDIALQLLQVTDLRILNSRRRLKTPSCRSFRVRMISTSWRSYKGLKSRETTSKVQ